MMEAKEVYLASGSPARNEGFEVHDGQDRYIAPAALIVTLTYFVMQNRAKNCSQTHNVKSWPEMSGVKKDADVLRTTE